MKVLYLFISLIVGMPYIAKSQNQYNEFIVSMLNEYRKQNGRFVAVSKKAVKDGIRENRIDNINLDSIRYVVNR